MFVDNFDKDANYIMFATKDKGGNTAFAFRSVDYVDSTTGDIVNGIEPISDDDIKTRAENLINEDGLSKNDFIIVKVKPYDVVVNFK